MIDRYSSPAMREIYSQKHKYEAWLKIELLACQAWQELGLIPASDMEQIRANAKINIEEIELLEQETKHDVIAFTRSLSNSLGDNRRWLHFGLTSSDVIDSAAALIQKEASDLIAQALSELKSSLKELALKHKYTLQMARTHGVHAQPSSLGLMFASWHEEINRQEQRFSLARADMEVIKISGAVGSYYGLDPFIERFVAQKLGLGADPISTQIVQRDRYSAYICALAQIASSLEKFATQIRLLQISEISELHEGFFKGQKGSSAMPHKKNPISCENVCGLARLMRGYAQAAMENAALWLARDISHSSVERIIMPDASSLAQYLLQRFSEVLKALVVDEKRCLENIEKSKGIWASGGVLHAMIRLGFSREEAYDEIQRCAHEGLGEDNAGTGFLQALIKSPLISAHLSSIELEGFFDAKSHLARVDEIYERLGLS